MWSRKQLALGVLALAVVPVVLTCVDSGWLFAPPGIDSWVYLGFFRHFPEYQSEAFPGTYYGSRLSWVLPGYFAHWFLPPITANYVLHLGVHLVAVLSLFEALRHTASPRAALLAALLLAGHGPFLESVGWDYVDGVGTAYYLLTWALLVRAARSASPYPWLFGAGVGVAAAVYSNLTWLLLIGLYIPGYAVLHRRWHGKTLSGTWGQVLLMFCGFAALTVVLGVANRWAGGPLLFYRPSIDYAISVAGKENPWAKPLAKWLPVAFWLIWPVCATLGSAMYLVRRQLRAETDPDAPRSGWWPVNLLVVALLFLAAMTRGQPYLQLSYYASYMTGPLMLACGTLLASPLARLSRRTFGAAVALVIGCAGLGAAGVTSVPLTVPLACTLVGFVGLALQSQVRWAAFACLALLAAGSALLPTPGEGAWISLGWNPPRHLTQTRHELYSRVTTAAQYIDEIADARRAEMGRRKVWFWYDATEPLGGQHMCLASLWLWGYSLINPEFPNWKRPPGWTLTPGDLVVVPSQRPDAVARALESGQDQDFVLRLLGSRPVGEGENQITLAVFVLEARH